MLALVSPGIEKTIITLIESQPKLKHLQVCTVNRRFDIACFGRYHTRPRSIDKHRRGEQEQKRGCETHVP